MRIVSYTKAIQWLDSRWSAIVTDDLTVMVVRDGALWELGEWNESQHRIVKCQGTSQGVIDVLNGALRHAVWEDSK